MYSIKATHITTHNYSEENDGIGTINWPIGEK